MTTLTDRCDEAMARAIADSQNDHGDGTRSDMLFIVNVMHKRYARAARLALLSELDAAGWQLAPKVATEEMILFGCEELPTQFSELGDEDATREIYAAMLAAAPKPFKEVEE